MITGICLRAKGKPVLGLGGFGEYFGANLAARMQGKAGEKLVAHAPQAHLENITEVPHEFH